MIYLNNTEIPSIIPKTLTTNNNLQLRAGRQIIENISSAITLLSNFLLLVLVFLNLHIRRKYPI